MLADNLTLFKQNLNNMLQDESGAMYKAAYSAYFEATNVTIPDSSDSDINTFVIAAAKTQCEQKIKEDAQKFAKEFCKVLKDEKFMDTIADEVDAHIKSMKILINVLPTGIATIVSPMGPCTGSLVIDDPSTASIQIL